MSDNIVINSSNIVNAGNNKLKYVFPRDVKFNKGDKLAISHLNVYYSWFNISTKYNNNFFQYKFWDILGVLQPFDVHIPDGFYTINTLYEYFQSVMVANGHILETAENSNYVYFIEFLTNATFYSIEVRLSSVSDHMDFGDGLKDITVSPVHVKAPTTWKVPTNFETPQIIIPSNSNFGKLIGFNAQTISQDTSTDSTNKQYSFLNDTVPNMNPSSSFVMTCNLIHNDFSTPNNILYSFTIPNGVRFGDLITSNADVIYSRIKEGSYKEIIISIKDQDFNDLAIIDPNMLIVMSVLRGDEKEI
jgi:hypothetical protein